MTPWRTQAADQLGVRTAILRIGIVLASDGGALGKMLPVFQIFAGGPLGERGTHRADAARCALSTPQHNTKAARPDLWSTHPTRTTSIAGSGRQWMSWIHRDDLVSLIVEAIQNPSYTGVFNATAPKPIRMGELCTALGARHKLSRGPGLSVLCEGGGGGVASAGTRRRDQSPATGCI